jgi:hypothetical protein
LVGVGFEERGGLEAARGDREALSFEAASEGILGGDTGVPEGQCDLPGLSLGGEVPGDAEEIAGVGPLGQGARSASGLEDGDGLENGVQRVAGGGGERCRLGASTWATSKP